MRVPAVLTEVRGYVCSPEYRALRSKYVLAGLDRLVTREDVFPVWAGMPRKRGLPSPNDFLSACDHALADWERMPRAPNRTIEKKLKKLGTDLDALADKLDQHSTTIGFCGVPLYVANHLASLSPERQDRLGRHRLPYLYDPDGVIGPVLIQALLRELAQRLAATDPEIRSPQRPRKPGAKNAERTFLVRRLAYFFRTNGGEPHWEWIALAVAAMTDGDPLDERHAQLLAEDIDPMFKDPGEELLWYSKLYGEPPDPDGD